jgi:hypothetical protein
MPSLFPYNSIFMFRVFWLVIACCIACCTVLFGAPRLRRIPLSGNAVSGFAVSGSTLYVWGEDAFAVDLNDGKRNLGS